MAKRFASASTQYLDTTGPWQLNWTTASFTPVTYSAWVRLTTTGVFHHLVNTQDTAGNCATAIQVTSGNVARAYNFFGSGGGAGGTHAAGTTSLSSATWYHLCAVFASTTDRRIYVNGVLDGSNTTLNASSTTPQRSTIGVFYPSTFPANADVSDVGIWNYDIGTTIIASLAAGFAPSCFRGGLIAHYPLLAADNDVNWRGIGSNLTAVNSPTNVDGPLHVRQRRPHILRSASAPLATVVDWMTQDLPYPRTPRIAVI